MKNFFLVASVLSLSVMGMENKWTKEGVKGILGELQKMKANITPELLLKGDQELHKYAQFLQRNIGILVNMPFCQKAQQDVQMTFEFLQEFNGNKVLVQNFFGIQEEVEQKVKPELVKQAVKQSGVHYLALSKFFVDSGIKNMKSLVEKGESQQDTIKKTANKLFLLFKKPIQNKDQEKAIQWLTNDGYSPLGLALIIYKIEMDIDLAVQLANAVRRMLLDDIKLDRNLICNPINGNFIQENQDLADEDELAKKLEDEENYAEQTVKRVKGKLKQQNVPQPMEDQGLIKLIQETENAINDLGLKDQIIQNWKDFSVSGLIMQLAFDAKPEYKELHKLVGDSKTENFSKIDTNLVGAIIESLKEMWEKQQGIQLGKKPIHLFQSTLNLHKK